MRSASWGGRRCVQSAERSGGWIRWDKEAINNVIGVPWRIVDGKWTVDRPTIQIDPLPPPVPFAGARVQRESITRTDFETFGTTAGRVAMRSDLEREHKLTQSPAAPGLRNVSKQLQKVQSV